jgi:peroxiredoxin
MLCDVMVQDIVYPAPRVHVRGLASDFTAPAVVNGEITSLKLSDYKGKWVVLFFYPKVGAILLQRVVCHRNSQGYWV